MEKVRTNVSISKDVLEKARKHNIIISSFLEIKLVEYLALLEGKALNQQEVFGTAFSKKDVECGRRDSNPGRGLGRP